VVTPDVLFYTGLAAALLHFSVPLAWYMYLKRVWYPRTWNLKLDQEYTPKITIVIPTYNEAKLIRDKLDNLLQQNYPHDKLYLIVIDSASTDGTPEAVQSWIQEHPHINATLLREPVRRGMVPALNYALKHVPGDTELVIFTDVDSFWTPDTLRNITKYFADPTVGAVTASIQPYEDDLLSERTYRDSYNIIRVAESKIHSKPIHNGALVAFRKQLLDKIGGLPTYTGNDDSTPATLIAFSGHRAIQIDDVTVKEPIQKNRLQRKIRRAQHLILHFLHTKRYAKKLSIYKKTPFDRIWKIESYLHLANPWLLLVAILALTAASLQGHIPSTTTITLGLVLLFHQKYRTWIENQLILLTAMIRNLWTKEIAWKK
jgi:glycosyltransferase involved in cell wall biosynthesis